MEIFVEGKKTAVFTPNEVILNINFYKKASSYEETLEEGSSDVLLFINELLLKNGFEKEDLKTRNFVIREEKEYNEITRTYDLVGYSYNQNAILKFDYYQDKLAKLINEISKLANPPMCQVNFGVKDEGDCRKKLLAGAYQDALEQAKIIASISGKNLKHCVKVDFKSSDFPFVSNSGYETGVLYKQVAMRDVTQTITNVFSPEDIQITETLYCLWIAE